MTAKKFLVLLITVVLLIGLMQTASMAAEEHCILPDSLPTEEISGGEGDPKTSGLNFKTSESGFLTEIRLWIAEGRSATQSITVWDTATQTKLAGPYTWTIDQNSIGWQKFRLPEALEITANTYYAVAVSNTDNFMSAIHSFWDTHSAASDVFTAYERGFSWDADTMPTNWNMDGTYLVDVVFIKADEFVRPGTDPITNPETQPGSQPNTNPESGDGMFTGLLLLFTAALLSCLSQKMIRRNKRCAKGAIKNV